MDRARRIEVLRRTFGVGGVIPPTIDPDLAIDEEDLSSLADIVVPVTAKGGEAIMREGQPGDSLFLVASGRLRISRHSESGGEIPVAELDPGAIVGELALLEGRARSASVTAEMVTELLRLDRARLKALLSQCSPLAYKVLFALTLHVSARLRRQDVEQLQARAEMLEGLVRQRTEDLERALKRESMINLITGAVRGHLDLDRVLQTTVEQVGRALVASRCFLMMFAAAGCGPPRVEHEYIAPGVHSVRGIDLPPVGADDPPSVHMMKTRRPYAIDDVTTDPTTQHLEKDYPEFIHALRGTHSVLLVPIFHKEELLGVLEIFSNQPRTWTEDEKDFAQAIADQVAVAIKQSMLYWELYEQKDRLADTLQDLQRKEAQLVQSEKMASLGQLVAGVAHELNNPISIVYGFLGHVGRRLDQLREALARGGPIDGEATFEELEDMLSRCKEGALRTKNIVADLRTFSRLDEAEFKDVDLHANLDSTLHLLEHRLGERISVHRHFGDLPPVACQAGQLNQVFMNILVNAIDAIAQKGGRGEIDITTAVVREEGADPRVRISIRDTGTGIAPDKLKRIFDPFYTTKPVGKGTGLGLSISHGIVEKQGGRIYAGSTPGKGTTFTVELPIGPRVT